MKNISILIFILIVLVGGFFIFNNYIYNEKQGNASDKNTSMQDAITVTPISHATMVLDWKGAIIYTDPVGGVEVFDGQQKPDIVVVTDIHGDHLNIKTLEGVLTENTTLIVPQAVANQLPETLPGERIVLNNDDLVNVLDFDITAIPMYNLPESADSRHTKGRGNGYVIEKESKRVYIAGDTAGIPEMRALTDIDIAFVPMNLPFTMDIEEAADAVLEFKPKTVYPFHYRGQDGLADINKFKELVNQGDETIEVILLDWYPET